MAKIITVSGHAQNGKDTFAQFAKEYYEYMGKKCIIFHYADLLKFICKQYYGWDGQKDENGRALLQNVGTEIFRKNNPTCWTDMAMAFVTGLGDTVDYIIIADTRFSNEISCWYKCMPHKNILTIRVDRPNFDNGLTESQKNHISEIDLDNYIYDVKIINDGSMEKFKDKVYEVLYYQNQSRNF